MKSIFVATFPFGTVNPEPIRVLEKTGWKIIYNPLGRRLKDGEVIRYMQDVEGVVAGTEPYTSDLICQCEKLEVISRVGVGLDNIDFDACVKRGVKVTYTPDAPADAVADLSVAQVINLLRGITCSDKAIRGSLWHRHMGYLVKEVPIGILGVGRIGKRVIKRLNPFGPQMYACDLNPDLDFGGRYNIKWVNKKELFETCKLVSIHVPLNSENHHCVDFNELSSMKKGSFLINTSRGPVLNEFALVSLIRNNHLAGAALDVFENEPYSGPLTGFDNVILTAHIGASASHSRYLMELGAAEDCVNILHGNAPNNIVPIAQT